MEENSRIDDAAESIRRRLKSPPEIAIII